MSREELQEFSIAWNPGRSGFSVVVSCNRCDGKTSVDVKTQAGQAVWTDVLKAMNRAVRIFTQHARDHDRNLWSLVEQAREQETEVIAAHMVSVDPWEGMGRRDSRG